MKKLLCILALLALCASSCAVRTDESPFAVFEKAFEADVTLVCNGNTSSLRVKYSPTESDTGFFEITVMSPAEAEGYVFTSNGEKYNLSFDGISIECNERLSEYPQTVRELLTPNADGVVSIGTEKFDGTIFSAVKTADVKYLFASDGVPVSASGVVCGKTVEIKFDAFQTLE